MLTSLLTVPVFPGVEGLSLEMSFQVDIRDYVNKELALRIHTDIDNQGTFFTDLNGFQVILGSHGTELVLLNGLQYWSCVEGVVVPRTGDKYRGPVKWLSG